MKPLSEPRDLDRLRSRTRAAGLEAIGEKVLARERLTSEDALALYQCPDPYAVGMLANHVRERMHGDLAYFNVNQHINYTNVCNKLCRFCAFQRLPGQEGAYIFSPEQIEQKLRDTADEPVTEVHMVAGIYPRLPYEYYLDILRAAKRARPDIHVKAFTMIELMQIARRAKRPLPEVLPELIEAGLGSCPGGGAEIFADRVQAEGYHLKNTGQQWLVEWQRAKRLDVTIDKDKRVVVAHNPPAHTPLSCMVWKSGEHLKIFLGMEMPWGPWRMGVRI